LRIVVTAAATLAVEMEAERVDHFLAQQLDLKPEIVTSLRHEFSRFGRNPMEEQLEILAIENGIDEMKIKKLFDLHLAALRKTDGLPADRRPVF